jgi:hypothetical protein
LTNRAKAGDAAGENMPVFKPVEGDTD